MSLRRIWIILFVHAKNKKKSIFVNTQDLIQIIQTKYD